MIGNEAIASFILCRPRKLGMTAETISFADQAVIDEIQSPKCSSFAALNTQVASFLTVMIEILLEKLGIKSCIDNGTIRQHLGPGNRKAKKKPIGYLVNPNNSKHGQSRQVKMKIAENETQIDSFVN